MYQQMTSGKAGSRDSDDATLYVFLCPLCVSFFFRGLTYVAAKMRTESPRLISTSLVSMEEAE